MSASCAEVMVKPFTAYLHVAAFLDLHKQWWASAEALRLAAFTSLGLSGRLQTRPVCVGWGWIQGMVPVVSRDHCRWLRGQRRECLLTDPGLDVETLFWQIVIEIK